MQATLELGGPSFTVVELAVDDEPLEIVLGPQTRVTVRTSANPDARMQTTRATVTDHLHGRGFDTRAWRLASGDKAARAALLGALAVFF